MSVAKVTLNGTVILDLTDATAGAGNIEQDYTAYIHDGSKATGTLSGGGGTPSLQSKSVSYTPTTATQTATVTADSGYDGLSSVGVTVNPIPSEYIIPSGSQTFTENGTYNVSALASAIVNVSGGGGSGIEIGKPISQTTIPSILNLFYVLEQGTAVTGTFNLATAIPNSEVEVFDTGLTAVSGCFIVNESKNNYSTGNTPENVLFGLGFFDSSGSLLYGASRYTCQMVGTNGTTGVNRSWLGTRCTWRWDSGKLYATGNYDKNNNYTPFRSGQTYRWVAW